MSIFDKISNLAKNAGDSAAGGIEITKLNSQITTQRRQILKTKEMLGDYFWQKHCAGQLNDPDATAMLAQIEMSEQEIVNIDAQIIAIREKNAAAAAEREAITAQKAQQAAMQKQQAAQPKQQPPQQGTYYQQLVQQPGMPVQNVAQQVYAQAPVYAPTTAVQQPMTNQEVYAAALVASEPVIQPAVNVEVYAAPVVETPVEEPAPYIVTSEIEENKSEE